MRKRHVFYAVLFVAFSFHSGHGQGTPIGICGFTATATSTPQPIFSPGWPRNYPANQTCVWNLDASPGQRIIVSFVNFTTPDCCDKLEISENRSTYIGPFQYAGNQLPVPYHSFTNMVLLRLTSLDETRFSRNFALNVTAIPEQSATPTAVGRCGFNATAPFNEPDQPQTLGIIHSPGWPGRYLENQDCTWTITASPQQKIRITFSNFTIGECCETLEISEYENSIPGYFLHSGREQPMPFISYSNRVVLRFTTRLFSRSAFVTQRHGFQLYFTAIPEESTVPATTTGRCGYAMNATSTPQPLTSPGWIVTRSISIECQWTITVGPDQRISVTFANFSLPLCCKSLEISENRNPHFGTLVYSGEELPPSYISFTSKIALRLISFIGRARALQPGFLLHYSAIPGSATSSTTTAPQIPICPEQRIATTVGVLTFESTELYQLGPSRERCSNTGFPLAAATCLPQINAQPDQEIPPRFSESTPATVNCATTLRDLINRTIQDLPTLSVLTSAPEILTEANISTAINTLEFYVSQSQPEQFTSNTLILATQTISNLFSGETVVRNNVTEANRSIDTKTRLVQTLNAFAERTVILPDNPFFEVITPDINVQVQLCTEEEISSGIRLEFNLDNARTASRVVAAIPVESIRSVAGKSKRSPDRMRPFYATLVGQRYSFDSSQNTLQILSIGVQNSSLTNSSVEITYKDVVYSPREEKVKLNSVKRRLNQASFVIWNYGTGRWETSQCDGAPPSRRFQCRQLGSYSILFSDRIVPSIAALEIVSNIGSALSIFFLLSTITIYVMYKELRDKPTTTTLVNICVCLVGVYLFFAIGVGRVSHHQTCNGLTFLLHYFTLASLSWMTVNAYQMFRAFTSLTYKIEKVHLKTYALAYGVPFVVVLFNFALTVLFLDRRQEVNDPTDIYYESLYRAKFTCWLQKPSFYWGFILPMGILLFINIAVFVILLKKIVFQKREVRSTAKDRPLVERLVNAISMVVMMGLTWIFGYFLLIPVNVSYETAMQWLFAIFNVFQGVVIFYLYCLRREKIRNVWLCCKKTRTISSEPNTNTAGTSKTGESKNTTHETKHTKSTVI